MSKVVTSPVEHVVKVGDTLQWPTPPLRPRLHPREPRSAAERWGRFVLLACDAEQDLRTTGDWASAIGAGHSTLREGCSLVRIATRDARDFMRVLRVMVRNRGVVHDLEVELKFADRRTLAVLLERAGLAGRMPCYVSVDEFLADQCFIQNDRPAIRVLRDLIAELQADASLDAP